MKWVYPLLFLLTTTAFAQVRIQNLYFNSTSNILRLNFSGSEPTVVYTGKGSGASIGEGIAHVEDQQGNVIIWVNANGVYDRNGTLMPGSVGILAHPSSTEIVVCPFPGNTSRYYVFYNNQLCSQLYYAVVNLEQRGGLGDVVSKNNPIDPGNTYAEGLEIVKIPCSNQYWLLAYQCYAGFRRFRISSIGIDAGTPIHAFNANNHQGRGELDYHNGKLGYAVTYRNRAFLCDFDPSSGTITHPIDLSFRATNGLYGLQFSHDASKAYFTDWNNRDFFGTVSSPNLFRYDFSTGGSDSWTIPYNTTNCAGKEVEGLGQIELARDGRLYIPHVGGCQITVVDNANSQTPAFRLLDVNSVLSTGVSDHIQSEVFGQSLLARVDKASICLGETVQLTASGGSGAYSWKPTGGLSVTSSGTTQAQPTATTTYTLYATTAYGCLDLASVDVEVKAPIKPVIEVVGNNPFCGNTAAALRATKGLSNYVWKINGTPLPNASYDSLFIQEAGSYSVSAVGNGCPAESDQVVIEPSYFDTPAAPFVPNVITPDQDASQANETFTIKNYSGKLRLTICNQWGKQVYQSNNYQNDWAAEGLPAVVYFYYLSQEHNCFPPQRGWIHVLR